jgi:hypothetical protein
MTLPVGCLMLLPLHSTSRDHITPQQQCTAQKQPRLKEFQIKNNGIISGWVSNKRRRNCIFLRQPSGIRQFPLSYSCNCLFYLDVSRPARNCSSTLYSVIYILQHPRPRKHRDVVNDILASRRRMRALSVLPPFPRWPCIMRFRNFFFFFASHLLANALCYGSLLD